MPPPLLVDDVAQPLGDVLVRAAQVVLVEHLPPALPEPLEDLAHAGDAFAVAVREAALHEPLQGLVEVAVIEELVGQLAEDVVGVEIEADLGAIPFRILEPGHWTSLPFTGPDRWPGSPTASLLRRLARCRPSSTNSVALATAAGDSSPARPEDHALQGGQLAEHLDEAGGRDVVAGVHDPAPFGVEVRHRVAQALGRHGRLEYREHGLLDQAFHHVAVAAFVDGLDLDLAGGGGRPGRRDR